jgi:hypothetical protein
MLVTLWDFWFNYSINAINDKANKGIVDQGKEYCDYKPTDSKIKV